MRRARIRKIVRQFLRNGIKLLLEDPRNVQDLLALYGLKVLERIAFDRMTVERTSFVRRDYRHLEADIVLRAPLRRPGQRRHWITVYILIEHQSEPDRLMILRVLDYVVQIYKSQVRTWQRQHASSAGLHLQPVLPVVLYTGRRPWPALGRLLDLIEMGSELEEVIPALAPLYIDLAAVSAERMQSTGGFFGWILRLVQERKALPGEFQQLLGQVIERLETMPSTERLRWLELLSYVHALVYHERDPAEHESLQEKIEASVQTDEHRQEVTAMGRTIADELMAKGRKQGRKVGREEGREKGREEGREEGRKEEAIRSRRDTLLRLVQHCFQHVPAEMQGVIEATTSIEHLDNWIDAVVTADSLADIGIR